MNNMRIMNNNMNNNFMNINGMIFNNNNQFYNSNQFQINYSIMNNNMMNGFNNNPCIPKKRNMIYILNIPGEFLFPRYGISSMYLCQSCNARPDFMSTCLLLIISCQISYK